MDLRSVEFAHDMKMPIQLIYSCVQLLEMELQSGGKAQDYLKMLMQSAHQLQTMVNNALDAESMPGTAHPLRLNTIDLVGEIRDICRQVDLFAREKQICVSFASNTAAFPMRTDGEKLDRILHNLLSNALKFTPPGGNVSVFVQVMGDSAEISVRDNGCGLPDADAVFRRGYTTGGYGHGLAIVRDYVNLMGGSITAYSPETGGSCFLIRLPVKN